jgi:hypothetical protein
MVTVEKVRGCGHKEKLEIDETSQWYEKKLAVISRTRCRACVRKLQDEQAKAALARKVKKSQSRLIAHKEHAAHRKINGGKLTIRIKEVVIETWI